MSQLPQHATSEFRLSVLGFFFFFPPSNKGKIIAKQKYEEDPKFTENYSCVYLKMFSRIEAAPFSAEYSSSLNFALA